MENDKMDYTRTKIYKIMSHIGDKIYIGSTTKKHLSDRMAQHRYGYKQWKEGKIRKVMSFDLFDEYGVENCIIILLESISCNTKDEKNAKEAHYIRTSTCVNKTIPGRTDKEYQRDNKEKIQEYQRKYMEDPVHKAKYSEHQKNYYMRNKERLDEIRNEIFNCGCGGHYFKKGKARHIQTIKHKAYEESQI